MRTYNHHLLAQIVRGGGGKKPRQAQGGGGLWPRSFLSSLSSSSQSPCVSDCDPIFQLSASNLRFGPGATSEVGDDLRDDFQCERCIVVTDRNVRKLSCFDVLLESLKRRRIDYTIFDNVRVEPNSISFQKAIDFFSNTNYDGVVAMGGGSVLDTAKAANLYACCPPEQDFYDYVNLPLGRGLPIPNNQRLKPLIAIPTTAGTGSETTGVAIFDDTATKSKTGIANRCLKPFLGIVDPNNTPTLPTPVATFSGLDVLCHAMESYTALPFSQRSPRPRSPVHRPAYQGSNPVSDVWALVALERVATYLPRVVADPTDQEARSQMLLASAAAGMGFGNAGVHLCHGMSYPVSSQVPSDYQLVAEGYPSVAAPSDDDDDDRHALIPHGWSVIVHAPAVFAWTAVANPERHAQCARILQQSRLGGGDSYSDTGAWLADEIRHLCQSLNVSMGLRQFGYTEAHLPALVEGTLPQHRVTKISPRPVQRADLEALFAAALDDK